MATPTQRRLNLTASLLVALLALCALVMLPGVALLALLGLFALWFALTRAGQQTWSIAKVGLMTIPQRLGSSSVVVVGIAGVVGVLVALLAMAAGFESTLKQGGDDATVIVMRGGAQTEINSVIDRDSATVVAQQPQIARDANNRVLASNELVVVASLPRKGTGLDANVEIRGVSPQGWALRPSLHLIAGRRFQSGLRELVVGQGAQHQFQGLDLGSTLNLAGQAWRVVGVFAAGDAHDSELWGDADVVAPTYRRFQSVTSVTLRLREAGQLAAYRSALAADPRLTVDVSTTRAYYSAQSAALTKLITVLGVTIASIMAVGAVFGALNTMYAAIAVRTREIATLRAMGFHSGSVTVAVLLETMLLALLGGVIGAAIAWVLFDRYTVSTLGSNFTQVVFAFRVTPALLATGLKWALAIGLLGGLFPALRAARQPITVGLREL